MLVRHELENLVSRETGQRQFETLDDFTVAFRKGDGKL